MINLLYIFTSFFISPVWSSYVSDFILPDDTNQLSLYESEIEKREASKYPSLSIQGRYKGILGMGLLEVGLLKQMTLGLGVGQFNGENSSSREKGVIPDLYHAHFELSYYLNSAQRYFQSGPVLRMAIHGSYLTQNDYVYSVNVDGKEIVTQENLRLGPSFSLGYYWSYSWLNASVAAEYFSLGPLKTLIPLSLSLGIVF